MRRIDLKNGGSGMRRIDPKDGDQLTIGRGLRRTGFATNPKKGLGLLLSEAPSSIRLNSF